ncbi:MAG: hypothetical protein CSA65_06720 [Proteobacteria bacterium]|nr:MAG: hypothetical protein CSB49_00300 [Pseudomonadota bacterium]PIE17974.1 MAG: hypothetical protein CSA65_06720 [Pseudomonadota bacterium]
MSSATTGLRWSTLLGASLRRLAPHPGLVAGLYLLAALGAAIGSAITTKALLGDLLAGRPSPVALDWAALVQLHHPRMLWVGATLGGAVAAWWLLISPFITAGALHRLEGRPRFFRGLLHHGPRLLVARLLTALALGTLGVGTFYTLAHARAAAIAAADERWQLAAYLFPLASATLIGAWVLGIEQQAQAARVRTRCDLTDAIYRGASFTWRHPLALLGVVLGAATPRLALGAAAVAVATQNPGETPALCVAQLAMLGRVIVGLGRLAAALELEGEAPVSNSLLSATG